MDALAEVHKRPSFEEESAELLQFSQSISSIHCIIEEDDEDNEDEASDMDSDREDDEIDSDDEQEDDLNDEHEDDLNDAHEVDLNDSNVFDLDDDIEDETEIDSDHENEVEMLRPIVHGHKSNARKSLHGLAEEGDIVREFDSDDTDKSDWFTLDENEANTIATSSMSYSGASSQSYATSEYSSFSHPIEPVIQPLSGKYRDFSPPSHNNSMSPPRRTFKRNTDTSKSERGFRTYGGPRRGGLTQSERGQRTLGGPQRSQRTKFGALQQDDLSRSERGLRTIGTDMSRSERGLRTIGADMSRSERGKRTLGSHDIGRSQRGLKTIGADISRSERGLRTMDVDIGRSQRGLRTIGADLSRSERGLRTIDADMSRSESGLRAATVHVCQSERGARTVGGPRRGPRRRHVLAHNDSVSRSLSKASIMPDRMATSSSSGRSFFSMSQDTEIYSMDGSISHRYEQSQRGEQGETDDDASTKGRSILNQLVSTEPINDAPFHDDTTTQSDPKSESCHSPSSNSNQGTNSLELLQRENEADKRLKDASVPKKRIFKSVAERLSAVRNDYTSHPIQPSASKPPLENQDSLPEKDPYRTPETSEHAIGIDEDSGANSETATRNATSALAVPPIDPSTIPQMVQEYHILAGRLKLLISSVSIHNQANHEWRDAKAEFLSNCDELCPDTSKEVGNHASLNICRDGGEFEIENTSRARIRQWFASIKEQQTSTKESEENMESSVEATESSTVHASLEPREVLDYVIGWEDVVSKNIGEQIGNLEKLKGRKDHYDRKIKMLQRRMSMFSESKKAQLKLGRNLNKQISASQTYDAKEAEVAFLLQQVTRFGWKDLYPIVEATMQEEWRRVQEERNGSFGKCLPMTITEVGGNFEE